MSTIRAITTNKRKTPFQNAWPSFWFDKIRGDATFTSFQVSGDSQSGINVADEWRFSVDVNYHVSAYASDATENVYEPGAWDNRDSGTTLLTTFKIPNDFTLPDASPGTTPNNPTIVLNRSTGDVLYLNACARPTAGGDIWGYIATIASVPVASTHGGSYLSGGEITMRELDTAINHALAINVYALKYLNNADGGFVSPALHADTGFDDSMSSNYYGGDVAALKMGSRLGIPPGVTAGSLSVSSAAGVAIFTALQTYGAYIVDNTGWDNVAINALEEAQTAIEAIKAELRAMCSALQLVS